MDKDDFSSFRVLVVEDDIDVARIIDFVLRDMGVGTVRRMERGADALALYTENPDNFNAIICDWMMPGMTGLDVLRDVRKISPHIPFVMLTAKVTQDAVLDAKEAGVTAYVAKPFTVTELQKKLRKIFAG